jgi:hypothetical protein
MAPRRTAAGPSPILAASVINRRETPALKRREYAASGPGGSALEQPMTVGQRAPPAVLPLPLQFSATRPTFNLSSSA